MATTKDTKKDKPEVVKPAKEEAKGEVVIRESSIIELMHQKGISREQAIEIYRNPE